MENEIGEIIGMKSQHTKAHTFASRTSPSQAQSMQKSVLFGNPERNSIFFSHPSVFYFFANSRQTDQPEKYEKEKGQLTTLCISNSGFSANLKRKTINQRSVLSDSLVA